MNLFDLIKNQLTDEVIGKVAGTLGENPASTQKALVGGAVPAVLAGLVNNFGGNENGAGRLLDLINAGKHDGGMLNNLAGALGGGAQTDAVLNTGKSLLGTMLGSRSDAVSDLLASFGGVRRSSASSLLSMAIPVILGVLGKQVKSSGMNAAGLLGSIGAVKSMLGSIAPPGLGAALGMSDLGSAVSSAVGGLSQAASTAAAGATSAATSATAAVIAERKGSILPWLIVPIAALLLFFGLRNCQQKIPAAATPAPEAAPVEAPPAEPAPVEAPAAEPAPAPAVQIEGDPNSAAAQLLAFLQDTSDTNVPRGFVLDNLNFATGTANLDAGSQRTIDDVAKVLNAYASTRVELQGHTDNRGNAEKNKELSQARADAVRNSLIALGIGADRLSAAGFGADKPIDSNDTSEGRAKNRRTEVVVTAK
jgi:outer membrane protein OmpA-like peptidoglycan-associated protein